MEHKHDLIDLNSDAGNGFGRMGEPAWACRICKKIITESCRFCGKLPCSNEKIGCSHE